MMDVWLLFRTLDDGDRDLVGVYLTEFIAREYMKDDITRWLGPVRYELENRAVVHE